MPPRLPHLALLVLTASLAAAAGACFTPQRTAPAVDSGVPASDAGDVGPSNLDGSCPDCLPSCEPTCASDAGCPFTTRAAFTSGCEPASHSLTVLVDADAGTVSQAVSLCSCGEAWAGFGTPEEWNGNKVFHSSCGRTVFRVGPAGERMILVTEPNGTVRLYDQRPNGTWRLEEPPQVRAPASLAIDSEGHPHIAGLGQGAVIHVARRVDGFWDIDPAANAGPDTRGLVLLTLGPDGLPRIAFSEGDVQLATRRADAGWEHSTASFTGQPLSLAVDAEGRAHLLFQADGVRYAAQAEDGTWVAELVDGKATAGSLQLTAEGCPRAVWSQDGVYYGERTSAGWTSERIADGAFGLEDEPFVLLPDGRPLVLHGGQAMSFSTR